MEVMFIIGLVLVFTLPFLTGIVGDFNDRVDLERRVQKATEIAQGIETISNLGPGNSITIITSYKLTIKDNSLILPGETPDKDVVVKLTPTIKDNEADKGDITIVNDQNEGVVVENFPHLFKYKLSPPAQPFTVYLFGSYFDNTSEVYYNGKSFPLIYINDTSLGFTPLTTWPSSNPTFVRKTVGGEILETETIMVPSNVIVASLGGSLGGG